MGYERKFIAILTVVRSVDVVSAKIQAIESLLTPWVISDSIWVSREFANLFGVGYSCIAVDT